MEHILSLQYFHQLDKYLLRPVPSSTITKQVLPKVIWEQHDSLTQLCNKVLSGYNGTPQIHPQNCPSPSTTTTHLIHPSLDRPHSPPQTASGSNHPFRHNTLYRQTDRQTDRPKYSLDDKSVPRVLTFMLYG